MLPTSVACNGREHDVACERSCFQIPGEELSEHGASLNQ